ncbi:hypothetical protein GOODEAATRI_017018 [Goodea atripinnis]|uniref:CUE domain-containing protein n=1 Tax=Goodea atripinnis TaxID=208336 RepID=A0ABV0N245_9TELE
MEIYFPPFQCSTLDDVLLSYITGVLEDLGSQQSVEENFDVEVFGEMLEAYVPGFAEIDSYEYGIPQLSESEWETQEQHLLEMFPKCSLSEARSALSIAKGDMEEAVRLIIEGDVQLSPTPLNVSLFVTEKH